MPLPMQYLRSLIFFSGPQCSHLSPGEVALIPPPQPPVFSVTKVLPRALGEQKRIKWAPCAQSKRNPCP